MLKIGHDLIDIWPGASYDSFCWLFYMIILVAMQYIQYSYDYAHIDNLTKLMDGLGLTLDYTPYDTEAAQSSSDPSPSDPKDTDR